MAGGPRHVDGDESARRAPLSSEAAGRGCAARRRAAEARLEIRLQRAQERMKETREMVERDRADVVPSLATDYVREVDAVRTELQSPARPVAAPDKVGRVITRLEANEQMLGAIVERVPEPARPAVARAVEVSRPDSVSTSSAPVAPSGCGCCGSAPAAPEPAAVAPPAPVEPAAPAAILPVAAPTFGPRPQSAALPSRTEPQSITGSAPAADPQRMAIPNGAGAAPAVLPPANSAGPAPRPRPRRTAVPAPQHPDRPVRSPGSNPKRDHAERRRRAEPGHLPGILARSPAALSPRRRQAAPQTARVQALAARPPR